MINEYIKVISGTNKEEVEKAYEIWDSLGKPLKSLGRLEEEVSKLAGIFGSNTIPELKCALAVMCADHGVVEEGVTQTGQEVTKTVADNFEKGNVSVSIMANALNVDVFPIDVGINCDYYENEKLIKNVVTNRKIAKGTKNFVKEPAMTKEECLKAIKCGIDVVGELKEMGYNIIATGEMGIGNTSSTSALAACFINLLPIETTGRGAGLNNEGLKRKIIAVEKVCESFKKLESQTPFDGLCHMGGFEIAAITGLFLGGGIHKIPVIVDGFISSIGALMAVKMCPTVIDYIFPGHESKEACARKILDELGLKAIIHGEMALGEGSGAIMAVPILNVGLKVYKEMGTFAQTNIEDYKELV